MKKPYKASLIAVLSIILNSNSSFSQPLYIQWQRTFGGTNYEQAESVKQTIDGGYIVAGISTSNNGDVTGNHGNGDFWIVKLTNASAIDWQYSFGGSGDDGAFAIEQTPDSGYAIAGSSTSVNGDVTGNHGAVDCWIVKLNSLGVLLWQKSLGGSAIDIAYDIHETFDNGFIVAGYSNSSDGDLTLNNGSDDYWIIKLDSAGSLEWQKSFGGSGAERAFSIQQTFDGGYITCGYTSSSNGDITNNHGDYDYWIVKLDSSGSLDWQKTLGGTLNDQAHSISETTDGGFIVSGFTTSSDGDVTFNHGSQDLWMVKLDSQGNIQWEKSHGGSGVDQAYSIFQTADGNYIVSGSSYSIDGDVTGNHGGYDYWIVKTDSAGIIDWEKSVGGSSVEEAYCIQPTNSGGYIIAGGTLSIDGDITNNHGDFDYWIVKLDSTASTGISENILFNESSHIYPNPVAQIFLAKFTGYHGYVSVKVLDVSGKIIFTGTTNSANQFKMDVRQLASGLYVFQISDNQGHTESLKWMKE